MEEYNEISIKDIIVKIWDKKIIIIAIIIMALLIGIAYGLIFTKPMYKSSTQILIDKSEPSIEMFAKSYEIANEVSNTLNINTDYIEQNIQLQYNKVTRIINITFQANEPKEACDIVNEYVNVLKTKLEEAYEIQTYNNLKPAEIASKPYNIDLPKNIIISVSVGVLISGLYIVFVVNSGENEEIRKIRSNKLMCIGKIAKERRKDRKTETYIAEQEEIINEFKKIIANIEFNRIVQKPSTIFVTGTQEGVGVSYVTTNLALRYAKAGKKVLIIDSDFNKGVQSKIFNLTKQKKGLTEIISINNNLESIDIKEYTSKVGKNIFVMPTGEAVVDEEVFVSDKIQKILAILRKEYDIILIDGKPIIKSSSSVIWSNAAETTILVLEYNKIKMKNLVESKENIEGVNGKISGVILNKIKKS